MTRRVHSRFSITGNDYLPRYYSLSSTLKAYDVNELSLTTALHMFPESITNTRSWKNIIDTILF